VEDKYGRIYQEGNLDYIIPLNFMLIIHKNSVPVTNKIHFAYTATTNWLSSCNLIISLHSEDHTQHVNKICGRNTLLLIRFIHSFTIGHSAKQQRDISSKVFF